LCGLVGLVTPIVRDTDIKNNRTDIVERCTKKYEECTKSGKKGLKYTDDDIDLKYQIPKNYNLEEIIHEVTNPNAGGWIKLEGMYSAKDIEAARERVMFHTNTEFYMEKNEKHANKDELHNNYRGMVWALIHKGMIFQKMAQHPLILNISDTILGQNSQINSHAANTVLPGMKGQLPHLDYPYYRNFMPRENPNHMDDAPPLSLQFVTLLTDFTTENGGTAIRPYSHIKPRYPDDVEDFMANALQMTGKAGDVVIFHGAIQHCAMPNKSKNFRSGILQHMAPVYIRTFEDIRSYITEDMKEKFTPELRRITAVDHPYPIYKA
jgi:ectoine hydroxylase-related dioxygenase (phytanoyl-CoA dioxygenase family)